MLTMETLCFMGFMFSIEEVPLARLARLSYNALLVTNGPDPSSGKF